MENNQSEPKLAAPGAGLPFLQRLLIKYYMGPFKAAKTPWEVSHQRFEKIHGLTLKEIEGLSKEQMTKKVLVKPLPGLEDSSRFWSIAMTLEHIIIVGSGVDFIITELTNHRPIEQQVDIALVKPKGKLNFEQTILLFKDYVQTTLPKLDEKMKDRNSTQKHHHPWFGPIDAKHWYWLLAIHGGIHLKQIQEIKKGL